MFAQPSTQTAKEAQTPQNEPVPGDQTGKPEDAKPVSPERDARLKKIATIGKFKKITLNKAMKAMNLDKLEDASDNELAEILSSIE